jgi:hypothetical protein
MPNIDKTQFVINKFVPTLIYVREEENFHTRLCIYNYFSELFPKIKQGATVTFWFFDLNGTFLIKKSIHIDFMGQLQFDVSLLNITFEGTVGLSMIPDKMPDLELNEIRTGYYAYYFDNNEHVDFSHELQPMRFEFQKNSSHMCVIRPNEFPETQLIVMNAFYGTEPGGNSEWIIKFRNGKGHILEEHKMDLIPPRGCVRIHLLEKFSQLKNLENEEGVLGIEVVGNNLQRPFTYVTLPSGDFNVHHFC